MATLPTLNPLLSDPESPPPDAGSILPYPDSDLLHVHALLSEEERARLAGLRDFFQAEIRPRSLESWLKGEFPLDLLPRMAAHDMVGVGLRPASRLLAGLAMLELTRADTSASIFFAVHNELFVGCIDLLGSEEQRARLLPDALALKSVGAFALTEPEHGTDISRGMETTATQDGDEWVIRGRKLWIGNATFADHVIVWARVPSGDQRGAIRGFIVETDRPGFRATLIDDKSAVRSAQNADVEFDDVRIPLANVLAGARSFSDTNSVLLASRIVVAWQAVGQQFAALDVARAYAAERMSFGRPIAAYQLVQEQLVRMLGNATMSLSLMIQVARAQEEGTVTMDQAALAKAMCTLRMRETVALGRSIMGGNGIRVSHEMAKIFADAEAIYTYEGTYEVNALLVGRAITGISAFG
jgi:glutaryl-CoA dehydrogenase